MTARTPEEALAHLLTQAGVGWVLGRGDADEVLAAYLKDLQAVGDDYRQRYGFQLDPLDVCASDPEGMKAFVQSLVGPHSSAFRTLIFRLVRRPPGVEIESVTFDYANKSHAQFKVVLSDALSTSAEGERSRTANTYESDSIWDVDLLRHVTAMTVRGKPVLVGYFPLEGAPRP